MLPDLIPVAGHIFNSRPLFFFFLSFFPTVAALSIRGTARSGFRPPSCIVYELYVMQSFMVMHFILVHRQILLLLFFVNRINEEIDIEILHVTND